VEVSARLVDGLVEVAVADTGSGIAPEDQDLIFEEFLQAHGNGDGARPEGTGLGLPLARRFIELHGGRLWVESARGNRQHVPLHAARETGGMSEWTSSS
jgi:signal transduction histidine kinase